MTIQVDEATDGSRRYLKPELTHLLKVNEALATAAKFARSVLAANPMEMSERMAIEKLDAALTLAEGKEP